MWSNGSRSVIDLWIWDKLAIKLFLVAVRAINRSCVILSDFAKLRYVGLRFSIWLLCCVRLTTSTHDIDFKFSGVKECNKARLKT